MLATYRKALATASMMLTGSVLAACSLFGGNDVKVRAIENISALTDTNRDSLYEGAVSAINAHDYARALDYLQEARSRDPRNVKALNAMGVVYDKLGRFDLSARYYAEARAVEPDSRIVAENMGYSKVLQGLMRSNMPTAVAAIELPANTNSAPEEKQPVMVVVATGAPIVAKDSDPQNQVAKASPVPAAVVGIAPPRSVGTALLASKKVLTIGHPVEILDASGKADRVGAISHRLAALGWTVRPSRATQVQQLTALFYSGQNFSAAKAMQRTLPFPVRLTADAGRTPGLRLVVGRDYVSWKPHNSHLAALWQKGTVVASLQTSPIKGVR